MIKKNANKTREVFMHTIEPFYNWIDNYSAAEDELSPFYRREYSEFEFNYSIYDHCIHPQWDYFGSSTLFIKILFADYEQGFSIIEMFGEWNDCLYNDIMYFKRNVIEVMVNYGINKFILIGENVLNFHYSDDSYYEEWFQDIENGWITAINFRDHVIEEFKKIYLGNYMVFGGEFDYFYWRKYTPYQLFNKVDSHVARRITA